MEDQIVGWEAAVREALQYVEKASVSSQEIAAKVIAKHLKIENGKLDAVLNSIFLDSGMTGAKEAIDQMQANGLEASTVGLASAVDGVNWDTWTPGNPEVANIVRGSRLWDLMSAAGANSIGVTTTNRIGTILANGIEAGSTYKEMGDQINALLKDRTRSDIVAITETNRAFQAAALDEYQQAGVTGFIWLAYAGACEKCLEQEGPHPIGAPYPPAHPNCRCGTKADWGAPITAATAPEPSWVETNMTAPAPPESSVIVNATPTTPPKPKKPKTTPKPKPKPNEVAEQPVHAPEAHPTITEPAISEPGLVYENMQPDLTLGDYEQIAEDFGLDPADMSVQEMIDNVNLISESIADAVAYKPTSAKTIADALDIPTAGKTPAQVKQAIEATPAPKVKVSPKAPPKPKPVGQTDAAKLKKYLETDKPEADKFTVDEFRVASDYQGSAYQMMNDILRGIEQPTTAYEKSTFDYRIKHMDAIYDKVPPLPTNVTTYRGIEVKASSKMGKMIKNLKPGMEMTDAGFTSTSRHEWVAQEFASGQTGRNGVILKYELPEGFKGVLSYERNRSWFDSPLTSREAEFVIKRKTRFVVHSIDDNVITLRPA